jgi:hypothetical protein
MPCALTHTLWWGFYGWLQVYMPFKRQDTLKKPAEPIAE